MKKDKFDPLRREPEDTVGTVYCKEDSEEYINAVLGEDVFPYSHPIPRYKQRHEPEPPII